MSDSPAGADSAKRSESREARLARHFRNFSKHACGDYSPLYRDLTAAIADDPDLLSVVVDAPADATHPGVILGAVRYLAGDHRWDGTGESPASHPLAQHFPEARGSNPSQQHSIDSAHAVEAFASFVGTYRFEILEVMSTRRVQTNEIARCSAILPALQHVAHHHSQPLALIDVGTSAGLNLLVDQVGIDYGTNRVGPVDSPLQLRCDLLGDDHPGILHDSIPPIGWRVGLDRSPIDLANSDDRRWLEACIWPEHLERRERFRAAASMQVDNPPRLVEGDALAALPNLIAEAPADHHLTVLTSWVVFYFTPEQRLAFRSLLAEQGRPLSWISIEHRSVHPDVAIADQAHTDETDYAAVTVFDYPGDGSVPEGRFLHWCHNHGAWID